MGLAEPRKRIKISHDPRNTSWTNSSNSYGQRLMQQQGWQSGQALGARGRASTYSDTNAAKVNVRYKDDTLGLGATLKSKDIASQRTGFDAFQGLLGRLNAKSEEEVHAVEKKLEDKKLAMFAQGRWGGMLFVPGGVLVQSDPYKQVEALKKAEQAAKAKSGLEEAGSSSEEPGDLGTSSTEAGEKAKRRAEKRQRKEEKRLRREARRLRKLGKTTRDEEEMALPTPDSSNATDAEVPDTQEQEKSNRKQQQQADESKVLPAVATVKQQPRNGRHLLRGRNIQAKRMAFADMKGLDEIFMKVG